MRTAEMLDAVERWAERDYWLMRETAASVNGRIDGLLVPRSFQASVMKRKAGYWTNKAAIVAVEVKATRENFLRRLREGQFERYVASSCGLFVVTTRDVKTSEVPEACGHVVCFHHPRSYVLGAACRRLPKWQDILLDHDAAWRIVFYAAEQAERAKLEARRELKQKLQEVGERFADILYRLTEGKNGIPQAVDQRRACRETFRGGRRGIYPEGPGSVEDTARPLRLSARPRRPVCRERRVRGWNSGGDARGRLLQPAFSASESWGRANNFLSCLEARERSSSRAGMDGTEL